VAVVLRLTETTRFFLLSQQSVVVKVESTELMLQAVVLAVAGSLLHLITLTIQVQVAQEAKETVAAQEFLMAQMAAEAAVVVEAQGQLVLMQI
jgi:hypothetical protein